MYQLVLMLHVIICVALVGLILVQQGKGAEIGASFGAGASQTVFGSQGSGSFLWKLTGGIGIAFFATSLLLGYISSYEVKQTNQGVFPMSRPSPVHQPSQPNNPVNQPAKSSSNK